MLGADAAHDVFHHHDRVIDDQTDGGGHAAERHDVEAHIEDEEQQDRHGQHGRHSHRGDERDLPVSQEQNQNERGQPDTDEDCVACAVRRGDDEIALVVPVRDLHAFGNLFRNLRELRLDSFRDLDRVAAWLLINLKDHGIAAICRHSRPLRLGGMLDRRDVIEQDHAVRR